MHSIVERSEKSLPFHGTIIITVSAYGCEMRVGVYNNNSIINGVIVSFILFFFLFYCHYFNLFHPACSIKGVEMSPYKIILLLLLFYIILAQNDSSANHTLLHSFYFYLYTYIHILFYFILN